jgi:uncharacterized protein (TIRG00374 family)
MTTAPGANVSQGQEKSWWEKARFGLGIVISLTCLWLVTRQVSWPQVLVTVQTADWGVLLLGCLLLVVTWVLFAVRWQLLLVPVAVPVADTFSYIMIGYLGNTILPLRLGDLGRIALISQKHGMNLGFTSATVLLERLFDVMTLVVLAGLLMAAVPVPELVRHSVRAAAAIALGALVALALLSRSTFLLASTRSFLSAHLSHGTLQPVFRLMNKFVEGLQTTRKLDQMLRVALLSLLAWGIAGLAILCFVRSFQLRVPWEAAFLVLTITNLGSAIPSSPGTIGLYEFLTMLALSTWVLPPSHT